MIRFCSAMRLARTRFGRLASSPVTVEITVGNDSIAYTQPWEAKAYGWSLAHR